MVSATSDGQSRRGRRGGRRGGITPKYLTEEQIVRITPDLVEVGYLMHDGMVLEISKRFSEDTGLPVEYLFETPHALITVTPTEEVDVYGRVQPEIAENLYEKYLPEWRKDRTGT